MKDREIYTDWLSRQFEDNTLENYYIHVDRVPLTETCIKFNFSQLHRIIRLGQLYPQIRSCESGCKNFSKITWLF